MGKILGLLGAAIAPPVAAFAFLQTWAKAHPVQAGLLLLAYEVVVWGAGLVGRLVGGTADELRNRWKNPLASRIDEGTRRRLSRYDRRYRAAVLGNLRFIDLKGLATVGFYTPQLDEVFVDVSLVYSEPTAVPTGVLGQRHVDPARRFIGDLIDKPTPVVLAVIGAPGCGKTTLLRHTALLLCRKGRRRRRVPVLLYLRDHVQTITEGIALPDLIHLVHKNAPAGWFAQKLHAGSCVVLLDGLDEVADQANRREIADWVERQVASFPLNDFVISSRPHGYQSAPVSGANVVQVRGFTDEQVSRFVRGWYLAFEQRSTGAKSSDVTRRADEEADDLLERLQHNPALYELTVNPLLLTMIANVHKFRGALPGSRVDLYSEICQVLLWRRQEAKKLESELTGDQKMALLSGLAFTMMRRQVRDITRDDMTTEFRPFLRRMARDMEEQDFVSDMTSSGLLLERERDVYSFAHLTFQEYLAAHHVQEKQLAQVLIDNVDDDWWRETTLLHVAGANADPVVNACLKSRTVGALSLAFDCAEQSRELAPELRRDLDRLLEAAFESGADAALRHLIMRVVVSREIRRLVRTAAGTRLCAAPVSAGVYQLFVQNTLHRKPDAPQTERGQPIVGVRAEDVAAFATWVNDITGNEPGFRLPRVAELETSQLSRKLGDLSAWTSDGDRPWPHTPDRYSITTQVLYRDLFNDFTHLSEVIETSKAVKARRALKRPSRALQKDTGLRVLRLCQIETSVYEEALGQALVKTIAPLGGTRTEGFADRFRQSFVEVVNNGQAAYVVPPFKVVAMIESVRNAPMTAWGRNNLHSFVTEGWAVFSRLVPLTPALAAELRVAAMCLAMETDEPHSEILRRIAAGVSFLERRVSGKIPAHETIVLATD
ncbi:NACHT domain-containing protein [Lentzea flava]|uniref:NACHT domain-containing protein n=1 Tax=Lentzea flava TaxID=103732 RepID=A0ABQ2V2D8_9PSEU|nr:NACHT domain-containing protein [Lentzea flava]MCP2202886.1 NACHT domain-containing protein [Lentzea flava]GGU62877.1 hypothetical protein GCM10010178_63730 [Lentzea flava]